MSGELDRRFPKLIRAKTKSSHVGELGASLTLNVAERVPTLPLNVFEREASIPPPAKRIKLEDIVNLEVDRELKIHEREKRLKEMDISKNERETKNQERMLVLKCFESMR
jgi:hypothetical protein